VVCGAYERQERCVKVVRLEGKRPLGRLRHRWEDNSKMVFEMDRIELAQDRGSWRALVIAGMNLHIS
jgi:hypothetical protein